VDVGEIARELGVDNHRVAYVIRTRGITPIGWAGHARVFAVDTLDLIESALSEIADLRKGKRDEGEVNNA
jgi:hypothetical protein